MSAAAEHTHDVAVLGSGPAGAAAAVRARQLGVSVVLLDRQTFPRARACAGWMGPSGMKLCEELGLRAADCGAQEFSGVRLHSWDLRKSAEVSDEDIRGWIVARDRFDLALLERAQKAGAETRLGRAIDGIRLGESAAELTDDSGARIRAKVLIAADGAHSAAARVAKLLPAGELRDLPRTIFAEAASRSAGGRLDVAVGAARDGQLAVISRTKDRVRVALTARDGEQTVERRFARFCEQAVEASLLPRDGLSDPQAVVSPAGGALELDAHVGKRCLLVGDAGGFVASFSNEGIYPAMQSGWIAAETAAAALAAPVAQDALATFDERWRTELAEYLRRPNTDLALLMPLVFGNEQMSRRIARAFVLGQAF